MVASDGGVSVAVTAWVDARRVPTDVSVRLQPVWASVDDLLEGFRWPAPGG